MKSYRAAIIGCGPRAWWHAKAYEQVSRGSLVACCNRSEQRLNEFSQQFNLRRGIHQWQGVLGLYASALWRKPIDIPFDVPDSLFTDLAKALS